MAQAMDRADQVLELKRVEEVSVAERAELVAAAK